MRLTDVSVVNVALPSIRTSLGFDPTGLQWVVNAYALTFAGFLLLGGRIADLYGRKRIFLLGLALFSLSSLAGGLAHTASLLIVARGVQGIGAAVLAPATLTIITTAFPSGPQRARALAAWAGVGAAGGATGGLIGGVLTQYLSWRWILLINVPIGAVVIALAAVRLAEQARNAGDRRRIDVLGAVLATAGLASITYGVARTQITDWSDPLAWGPLAGGVVALVVFLWVEQRVASAPLMPLWVFRQRVVSVGNVLMLLLGAAFFSMWYFLTLYMQNVLHYSALTAGIAFVPHALMIVAGTRLAPRLMDRFGARTTIVIGAVCSTVGFAWQGQITPTSGYLTGLLGPAILMCGGLGLLMTPVASTVTSGAGAAEAGLVSGLLNAARQVGGSLGLAVLASIAGRGAQTPVTMTDGYAHAFLASAVVVGTVAVVVFALPARSSTTD